MQRKARQQKGKTCRHEYRMHSDTLAEKGTAIRAANGPRTAIQLEMNRHGQRADEQLPWTTQRLRRKARQAYHVTTGDDSVTRTAKDNGASSPKVCVTGD